MLDPASAIGLAASIAQLLTFASGLLKKGREIYNSAEGATIAGSQMEIVANTLVELTSQVREQEHVVADPAHSKAEVELQKLCSACVEVSQSLLDALNKLKRKEGNKSWNSIRQALRFVWNENKINSLSNQIESYRRQIDTALLLSIR